MDENHSDWRNRIECRIEALEGDFVVVKTDLAVIRNNYCTKEDLARLETRMTANMAELERRLICWFIATSIALATVCFGVARFLA
jgi:hypothetical protein